MKNLKSIMNNKLKSVGMKNGICYFFDGIIFNKINGHFKEINKTKHRCSEPPAFKTGSCRVRFS